MTAFGTKLSIANVRSTAAFRGKAESVCSTSNLSGRDPKHLPSAAHALSSTTYRKSGKGTANAAT
jgi:hypothetical protein